jgi:mono/diheme cytochrome c family protein
MPKSKSIQVAVLAVILANPARAAVDFVKDVAPILQAHCIECHGPEKPKAKLRLDSKAGINQGGRFEDVVKVGDAQASELHRRVRLPADDVDRMPPEGDLLTPEQIEILAKWINEGANWPDDAVVQVAKAEPAPAAGAAPSSKPAVPAPVLPDNYQPSEAEKAAITALANNGIEVRAIAQDTPWREVNLRPQGESVTDESIAPLKDVGSLVEARLGGTKVTDEGLAALEKLTHLQVLGLELTAVTDKGVARLKGLTNLTYLNLYGTSVTDAALEHLAGMKHLRNLYLWQTQVTPEGVRKLQEALPGLNINTGAVAAAAQPAQ